MVFRYMGQNLVFGQCGEVLLRYFFMSDYLEVIFLDSYFNNLYLNSIILQSTTFSF